LSPIAKGALARCSRNICADIEGGPQLRATMASILITRDQFNITPQGITHKPTEASFTPHCGDPLSGSVHLGQLESQVPKGDHYDADVVKEIMTQLWSEYVAANSDLFYQEQRPVAGGLADTRS
jgi:hypothetical protein